MSWQAKRPDGQLLWMRARHFHNGEDHGYTPKELVSVIDNYAYRFGSSTAEDLTDLDCIWWSEPVREPNSFNVSLISSTAVHALALHLREQALSAKPRYVTTDEVPKANVGINEHGVLCFHDHETAKLLFDLIREISRIV